MSTASELTTNLNALTSTPLLETNQSLSSAVLPELSIPIFGGNQRSRSIHPLLDPDPGNTLDTALDISLDPATNSYVDSVGDTDTDDYYRFTLTETRSISLFLNGLTANADLELFNSSGTNLVEVSPIAFTGHEAGTNVEAVSRILSAGIYYIRVFQSGVGENTPYQLGVFDQSSLNSDSDRNLAILNFFRTQSGLNPLADNAQLTASAQRHSQDMANNDFLSHTGSDGSTSDQRIAEAGYQGTFTGENIAYGYLAPGNSNLPYSIESAIEDWMNDAPQNFGHRDGILSLNFTDVGVSSAQQAADQNGFVKTFWTQDFGGI